MAELSEAKTAGAPDTSQCCAPERQANCCKPSEKATCCPPESSSCACCLDDRDYRSRAQCL